MGFGASMGMVQTTQVNISTEVKLAVNAAAQTASTSGKLTSSFTAVIT